MAFVRVVDSDGMQRFLNSDFIVQLTKANKTGEWAVHMATTTDAEGRQEGEVIVISRDSGDILLKELRNDGPLT